MKVDHVEWAQHRISLIGIKSLERVDKRIVNLAKDKTKEVFTLKITYEDSIFQETFDDVEARDTCFDMIQAGVEQRNKQTSLKFEKEE